VLVKRIFERLSVAKKPPEEITVKAKFKELKVLMPIKLSITKIENVIIEYNKKIFNVCFKVSALLKEIKLVRDFLKLLSKMSINKIIENKK
tara:strand:+ start:80 stop:352 length:273 start_codon:yes stop_codon:yes gene_type:complete